MAEPDKKPAQPWAGIKAPEAKGYYSALGLAFDCEPIGAPPSTHIQKKYKRLALLYHPDKAGASSENVDRFQAVTTAYSVLNHEESRNAYWEMYRIRCYLHQGPATSGQDLAPFYLFQVRKQEKTGLSSDRLLSVDLCGGHIQNWKKDVPHRRIPFEDIKEVKTTGSDGFVIKFRSDVHDYKLFADTSALAAMYAGILERIIDPKFSPRKDDELFPPYSTKKGYVEKRGKSGEWQRRWILLGAGQLLIFRAMDCVKLVNAIPVAHGQSTAQLSGQDGGWEIKTATRSFALRNTKVSIATEWVKVFNERMQASAQVGGVAQWLGGEGTSSAPSKVAYSGEDIDEELGRRLSVQLLMDEGLEAKEDDDKDSDGESTPQKSPDPSKLKDRKRSAIGFGFMMRRGQSKKSSMDSFAAGDGTPDGSRSTQEELGGSTRTSGSVGAPPACGTPSTPPSVEAPEPELTQGDSDVPVMPPSPRSEAHRQSARKAAMAEQVGRGIAEDFSNRMVRNHL